MPEDVETIERSAFIELDQLKKLNFPQSLKRIEERAFVCCGFSKIWIPSDVTVADDAFHCFKNGLKLQRAGNYTEFERSGARIFGNMGKEKSRCSHVPRSCGRIDKRMRNNLQTKKTRPQF